MDIESQKLLALAFEAINGLPEAALRDALRYFVESEARMCQKHNLEDRSHHLQIHLAAYHEGYRASAQRPHEISITV